LFIHTASICEDRKESLIDLIRPVRLNDAKKKTDSLIIPSKPIINQKPKAIPLKSKKK